MRQIAWVFIILSPLIALTQSYMTTPAIAATGTHLAHLMVAEAGSRITSVAHAIQTMLT